MLDTDTGSAFYSLFEICSCWSYVWKCLDFFWLICPKVTTCKCEKSQKADMSWRSSCLEPYSEINLSFRSSSRGPHAEEFKISLLARPWKKSQFLIKAMKTQFGAHQRWEPEDSSIVTCHQRSIEIRDAKPQSTTNFDTVMYYPCDSNVDTNEKWILSHYTGFENTQANPIIPIYHLHKHFLIFHFARLSLQRKHAYVTTPTPTTSPDRLSYSRSLSNSDEEQDWDLLLKKVHAQTFKDARERSNDSCLVEYQDSLRNIGCPGNSWVIMFPGNNLMATSWSGTGPSKRLQRSVTNSFEVWTCSAGSLNDLVSNQGFIPVNRLHLIERETAWQNERVKMESSE
jgi:hypothetical protein